MKALFIAGTDTGVGKTLVTGLLARYLSGKGYNVVTQKWIQTGSASVFSSDIKLHFNFMKRSLAGVKEYFPSIAPYIFKTACSPHLASRIEKRKIRERKIIKDFRLLSGKFDFVIVEGIGGALVPYDKKHLVIDIAKKLDLPALVVAENKLGAINHSLLTIEALVSRKIKILGFIFNNIKRRNNLILKDNPQTVSRLTKQRNLGVLPRLGSHQKIYQSFIPIAEKILRAL